MAHPFHEHRQTKKEHSRVGHITKGYKSGGAVKGHSDEKQDRKLFHKMMKEEMHADGGKSKHRMDKPHRAKGGRVGKKKGNSRTIVNVITGGHPAAGAVPPMPAPPMGIAGPPPGAAMPPPMAAKPPMPMPPPGAGGPPPGMPMRARGGAVKSVGMNVGTKVQHSDGKGTANKPENLNRGKPVTFSSGGKVKSFYARGGKIESPEGVAAATKMPGGSAGGEARLFKEHRQERRQK